MNDQKAIQKKRPGSAVLLFLFIMGALLIIYGIVRLISEKPEFGFSGTSFTIKNGLADLSFGIIVLIVWAFAKKIIRTSNTDL